MTVFPFLIAYVAGAWITWAAFIYLKLAGKIGTLPGQIDMKDAAIGAVIWPLVWIFEIFDWTANWAAKQARKHLGKNGRGKE